MLHFDEGGDHLAFTTRLAPETGNGIRTVFWVIRDASVANGYRSLLGDGDGFTTRDFFGGTTTSRLPWGAYTGARVKNGQTWLNGEPVDGTATERPSAMSVLSVVTTGDVSASNFAKDYSGNAYNWHGDLAELIVYDTPLSGPERRTIEEYLTLKYGIDPAPAAGIPTASPNGGGFVGSTQVTLSVTTPDAEIFYTTDGSEPSLASSPYVGAVTLDRTATLKAKALRSDLAAGPTLIVSFWRDDEPTPADLPGVAVSRATRCAT